MIVCVFVFLAIAAAVDDGALLTRDEPVTRAHWMSDVVGALVLGALYLLGVEWLLDWHHRRRPYRDTEFDAIVPKRQDGL